MTAIWRDVRHSLRSLRKSPGFLVVVVLTLGLGIGANAAIFSLMDQLLLRPLPVNDPGALVLLDGPPVDHRRRCRLYTGAAGHDDRSDREFEKRVIS